MNEVLFLCLGLGLGMGVAGWQRLKFERSLERLQRPFPVEIQQTKLSSLWKVRRGLAWLEEKNVLLEIEFECCQAIVAASPLGYLQVDHDNYLQRSNAAARSMLGLSEQATMTPRLLLELVRSYELDRLIEKTRKTGEEQIRFWTFHPTSASVSEIERCKPLALCGHSLVLPNGHIGVWLENQQEIVELKESRDRWVADLAHELRTPLTSIKLVAETLGQRLEGTMRTWAERLIPETDRLITLVQDWLDLTKLDTERFLASQTFPLAELIDDIWATLEPIAQRRGISLQFHERGMFQVEGNRDQMFRVFLNLIDNAIQYSPNDHAVSIAMRLLDPGESDPIETISSPRKTSTKSSGVNGGQANRPKVSATRHMVIDIIDSGSGFSETDLPHIFERLYRGDRSRVRVVAQGDTPARHTSGSGLGLAIVEQIIQAHHGTVTARNVPQGTGAWLQVILPISESS
jgi:two-component system phosphate regulon sensor histidine kinase PhoR